jgi:hypothetical protein
MFNRSGGYLAERMHSLADQVDVLESVVERVCCHRIDRNYACSSPDTESASSFFNRGCVLIE